MGLALLTVAPAFANVTRVSELVDVDPNVWAYKALKELVEKYDVLEGYPDKTFRGNKPATRYELAQALYEVIKVMDTLEVSQVDGTDLGTVNKLKQQFDRELASIQNKVASLEGRVSALEAGGVGEGIASSSWTDRIRLSGDLTNQLRYDHKGDNGDATWGTRARLGLDAVLIADDNTGGALGEGIAHIRLNAGNGGPGTYGYATSGTALDDILFDGSNPTSGSNNSLYGGRTQDSRMDAYLDQAYYTQVFKFSKADPCTNEVKSYPNFFAVVDLGQQDLWNTFHKSLVREDSLDGFTNQRILHGGLGGSDAITEALHVGLTWLGGDDEGQRVDECGNPKSTGLDDCGQPLPAFFQAFSLDGSVYTSKATGEADDVIYDPNDPTRTWFVAPLQYNNLNGFGYSNQNYTTTRVGQNLGGALAANLLFDLPGQFFNTGLFTLGATATHLDRNWTGIVMDPFGVTGVADYLSSGSINANAATFGDDTGWTIFTKWEQYLGRNRTVGLFFDYAYNNDSTSNYAMTGPLEHIATAGAVVNMGFMPTKWNFNKDQVGLAYSYAVPFNNSLGAPGHVNNSVIDQNRWFSVPGGIVTNPLTGLPQVGPSIPLYSYNYLNPYLEREEHIVEAYYRKYITENISLTPGVLFNVHPNGSGKNAVSAYFRSTFKLPNWNDGGAFDQFGYRDWSQRIAKYKAAHSTGVAEATE